MCDLHYDLQTPKTFFLDGTSKFANEVGGLFIAS